MINICDVPPPFSVIVRKVSTVLDTSSIWNILIGPVLDRG